MDLLLTIVSVATFLVWSLLTTVGVASLASRGFHPIGILLLPVSIGGLAASTWIGFLARNELSDARALLLELALLFLGLFAMSSGILLLSYLLQG